MTEYRIIFRGKLNAGIPASEIRERLLKLYKDKHETVNLFLTGRSLVVRKHLDFQTAQKYRTILEKAGVPCEIVEDLASPSVQQEHKAPAEQSPAPQKETVPSGGGARETAQPTQGPSREHRPSQAEVSGPLKSIPSHTGQASAGSSGGSLLKGSRLQNTLAAIMIAMIILSAGIRIRALQNADGIHPPDQVTSNENEVCVHFNGTLFFLTADGRLTKRVALSTLGLKREPADLQLLKNGDFIIGSLEKGEILRCDGSSLACRKIGPAGEYTIDENFKFLADEERNLLFISDTNNHALLVQGLDGSAARKIEAASDIGFPNGMALDKVGRLWVSNTAKSEILSFEIGEDRPVQAAGMVHLLPRMKETKKIEELFNQKQDGGRAASLKDLFEKIRELRKFREELGGDLVHTRPLAIAWDSEGNLWAAAGNGLITSAGLRVFNPEGNQIMSLSLGKGSIPVDISTMGEHILIADTGLFQFFSTAPGMKPALFGDEAFQRELSQTRQELRRYEAIRTWAGRSIWLLALGTLFLVAFIAAGNYRRRKRTSVHVSVPAQSATTTYTGAGGAPEITKHYGLEFTGSGAEYFRIWIVNVFLTILTLGIYAPWAKVRSRRYFYRNTLLAGHPFDYTADPMALLKGYGIVAAGLLLYYIAKYLNPAYSLIVFALFSFVLPLLIYKSLRFFAHNSTYRNIRFRFLGSLGESYRTYLLCPVLIPFTLGLIVPYWEFRRKKYFYNSLSYGATPSAFNGAHGPFYILYIKTAVVMALFVMGGVFCAALLVPKLAGASLSGDGSLGSGLFIGVFLTYAIALFIASFFQMYIYAWTMNYCMRHSELGELRFESTLSGGRLFWIRISNIIAIVLSVGLLTPWAKVRRMKYIADNLFVITARDLGDFASASTAEESSYGDAATDYLGFEIGL